MQIQDLTGKLALKLKHSPLHVLWELCATFLFSWLSLIKTWVTSPNFTSLTTFAQK